MSVYFWRTGSEKADSDKASGRGSRGCIVGGAGSINDSAASWSMKLRVARAT